MKLVDTNVWLAQTLEGHDFHRVARDWFETETAHDELLFCRSTQQSFLRLLTTASVFRPFGDPPLSNREAWEVYRGISADPRIGFALEPDDIEAHWHRLGARQSVSPKLWMDAYLAAFAIAGGYSLTTIDAAFRQFGGLDLILLEQK